MDIAVQTFDPTPEPSPRPAAPHAPQLRTLLLTDLVDSTGLVERLGDAPASDLFRAHDRLVLQLQQQWRGRLIDRSDGMLLLFERPIDGLGFALDYTRGLIELGKERSIDLRARVGLHVGEVLTWRNSDEAVSIGAKPLEVEGLAKPIAARLMAIARPGQILLSAVAEPLAHRAARELGERGQHLVWKSWGRWRFKGVPEAQQIFEVGEPGIAPLRMPPNTPKAWRDVPLWRRPAALAAEVAAVLGIAIGVWFIARPEPAIAFNQRDWVVVGDLRNLTGQAALDQSLEQALRISLEQSRYVNVLSDMKAREILASMQRSPETVLDRTIASEIAVRSGARAVVLPTVAETGGRVRVSIEVIDPQTQATVFAESASGRGLDSVVHSVGEVSQSLRSSLGETLSSIQTNAVPLEQATTSKLDALRAFTLGQEAYAKQELGPAEQFFNQALIVDPGFAMARIGLARVAFAKTDVPTALQNMQLALKGPIRLTDRERLYALASQSMYRWDRDFLEQWQSLSKLYPDFHVAAFNTAMGMRYANRYKEMGEYSRLASADAAITRPAAYYYGAIAEFALGHFSRAQEGFAKAQAAGFPPVFVEPALMEAAQRHFEAAGKMLGAAAAGPPQVATEKQIAAMTLAADSGNWQEAERLAKALRGSTDQPKAPFEWAARAAVLSVQKRFANEPTVRRETDALISEANRALPMSEGRAREAVASAALYAGYVAAVRGDRATVRRALSLARPVIAHAPQPVLANMAAIVEARLELYDGNADAARALLKPYRAPSALALTGIVLAMTQDGGATPAADSAARARAYAEWSAERPPVLESLQPTSNVKKRSTR